MEIAIILILITLHGFLVLGEIALLTAKRSRLEGEKMKGNANAAIAVRLLDGLSDQLPDFEQRRDHIFRNMLYGTSITDLTGIISRRSAGVRKVQSGRQCHCPNERRSSTKPSRLAS